MSFMTLPSITPRRSLFAIDRNLLPAVSQNFKNAWNSKLYSEKSQKRYLVQTNQRKIKDLITRFHSWNHLFMSDAAKASSRSAKKCTPWRSCDAQKNRAADAITNQNSRNLVQIIALLLVYRHLHRKYKIYCSKTRCKTARKTIEYLQNAILVS
jgi:hypothetical protein